MTDCPDDVPRTGVDDRDRHVLMAQARALDELLDALLNVGPEEAEEQRETFEFLVRALDIDRLSDRLLFPWEWNEDACSDRPASEWRVAMALPHPDKRRGVLSAEEEEERRRLQREKNQAAIDLLRTWREGDDEDLKDQQEIMKALRHALGDARPGYRKLF